MISIDGARTRVRALTLLHATIAESIASCLHEPPHVARRLAWRTLRDGAVDALRNRRELERLARGRPFEPRASADERLRLTAFARYAAHEPAPKIVAAIHTLELLPSAFAALDALPSGMRVHAPVPERSIAALTPIQSLAAGRGKELRLLPLGSAAFNRLRRLDGEDVVFTMLDLDASYGRAIDVLLFGQIVRVVVGPYALASRLGASIVYLHRDGGALELDPPHDACVHGVEGDPGALAARFARRIERSIAVAPTRWSRWHTWPRLRIAG